MDLDVRQGLVRPNQISQGEEPVDPDVDDPMECGVGIEAAVSALPGCQYALDGVQLEQKLQR